MSPIKQINIEAAPRYRQIHQEIRNLIVEGKFLPGEAFFTEKEITQKYGVSRFTAQHVFRLLVEEGLVVRRQGLGTFVKELASSEAGEIVTLTLGSLHVPETPLTQAQFLFARRVAELVRNQVHVEIKHSSILGSGSEQLNLLSKGKLDMFCAGIDWLEKLEPSWEIVNLPFLFSSMDHAKRFTQSETAECLREELLQKKQIRVLADNWLRPSHIIFAKKPCFEVEDFLGLKLRVPSINTYRELWRTLGASPVDLAFSEIFSALKSNRVEAVDVPRDVVYREGFHRLAPYVTHTRHRYSRGCIVISEKCFQNLRSDIQEALITAAREVGEIFSSSSRAIWEENKQRMIKEGARFIITDTEPFREKSAILYRSKSNYDKYFEEITAMKVSSVEADSDISSCGTSICK
jgi:TRAP-type transport system periplasmic protein